MSDRSSTAQQSPSVFTPPAYDEPHVFRQIEEIVAGVTQVVSRVWPLRDYVAINPYAGIAGRTFADARGFLQLFSDCELLMPLEYYRSQYAKGQFTVDDVRAALAEGGHSGIPAALSAEHVMEALRAAPADETFCHSHKRGQAQRPIRTLAECADQVAETTWTETIVDEISKFCSAHYDQAQSSWQSPWRDLPLYQAWRTAAMHDRNPEILGLTGFREFVQALPHTPLAAIVDLLSRLQIPTSLWESFLLCQVFSIPGWCAWAKYHDHLEEDVDTEHLLGLLAIRLAYDVALSEVSGVVVKWDAMIDEHSATFRPPLHDSDDDSAIRTVLLRASEIGYRNEILRGLATAPTAPTAPTGRKLAQLVFCIDVRSERLRRHLESLSPELETFGFAGFFGLPIEYVRLGDEHGDGNVPALIKPQFQLRESVVGDAGADEQSVAGRRQRGNLWKKLWWGFQKSSVGCFSFVETTGLFYAAKLFRSTRAAAAGTSSAPRRAAAEAATGPTLQGLEAQGISRDDQVDLAESVLTNLGLTGDFARLVVLCGHGSSTTNNPLAAGLDCGACGGHTGEANARFGALLLNDPWIRQQLVERGIEIPEDTHFLPGLHNTTTDEITFFDTECVPTSNQGDLRELNDYCQVATVKTRRERTPLVGSGESADLIRRARDWSEVRPEWGLAGNAAFIVGPRSMTQDMNLDGRIFLHSYRHECDPDGAVLENIMTAPMVVAHWINMQYYASTVDNRHFGAGDKTIHNVVGGFGVLAGNGGDLMTGLPLQSLHDGRSFQHLPVRLQVIIAAPTKAIARVIETHESIKDLVDNDWLHLTAIEDGQAYRYSDQDWQAIPGVAGAVK